MKKVVIAWMIFLPVMFVLSYLIAETYPTFVMPGFARIYHNGDNTITFDEPVISVTCADSSVKVVPYASLFSELQNMSPTAVMKNEFTSSHLVRTAVDTNATSIYQRMKRVRYDMQMWASNAMHSVYGRATDNKATHPQTREWLRKRLAVLLPQSTPLLVAVRWNTSTYELRDTSLVFVKNVRTDSVFIPIQTGGTE